MRFVVRAINSAAHRERECLRQTKRCGIISNDTPRVIVSEVVRLSRRSRFSVAQRTQAGPVPALVCFGGRAFFPL